MAVFGNSMCERTESYSIDLTNQILLSELSYLKLENPNDNYSLINKFWYSCISF